MRPTVSAVATDSNISFVLFKQGSALVAAATIWWLPDAVCSPPEAMRFSGPGANFLLVVTCSSNCSNLFAFVFVEHQLERPGQCPVRMYFSTVANGLLCLCLALDSFVLRAQTLGAVFLGCH